VFWNIPGSYASRLTMEGDYTCPRHAAHGPITAIALAGVRAAWVTASDGVARLVTATIVACEQHLVDQLRAAAGAFGPVDGQGSVLAYARTGSVDLLSGSTGAPLASLPGDAIAVSSDGGRVAVLRPGGSVELRDSAGHLLQTVAVGSARAIALRASTLVALDEGVLRVYDATTASLLRTVRVPAGTQPSVAVEDGVAVLTAGRSVYAVGLGSGRVVLVARAPARVVAARIDSTGIAYGYDLSGLGRLRFVPLSQALALVA
jgi:hypothetical protein